MKKSRREFSIDMVIHQYIKITKLRSSAGLPSFLKQRLFFTVFVNPHPFFKKIIKIGIFFIHPSSPQL